MQRHLMACFSRWVSASLAGFSSTNTGSSKHLDPSLTGVLDVVLVIDGVGVALLVLVVLAVGVALLVLVVEAVGVADAVEVVLGVCEGWICDP